MHQSSKVATYVHKPNAIIAKELGAFVVIFNLHRSFECPLELVRLQVEIKKFHRTRKYHQQLPLEMILQQLVR